MRLLKSKISRFMNNPKIIIPFFHSKYGLLPYHLGMNYSFNPGTIFIAINSTCNLRCKMCDVGQFKEGSQFFKNMVASGQELTLMRLKKLVDEVKGFHPVIAVTSTEPLLYKDLMEFSRYVVNNGLQMQITTNGYLLPRYAEEIVKAGVHTLAVSIDGPPEIHNEIRGRSDSFQRAYEGISLVNEIKKRDGMKYPEIHISYSISNYNFHALTDFMESIRDLNVDRVLFSHLNFITNEMAKEHNRLFGEICRATPSSISAVDLSEIDIDRLWEQIQAVKTKYQNCYFIPEITKDELRIFYQNPGIFLPAHDKCKIPWQAAQILANGDLTISTRCFNIRLGNINEQSFKEAWNSKEMRTFRKELRKVVAFPACSRCCGVL